MKATGTADREVELVYKNQRAFIGLLGASLRKYFVLEDGKPRDVLWGYSGKANKMAGQGDVLIPFAGRIKEGLYHFEGEPHTLEKNDKEGPNAIHGFMRDLIWETEAIRPAMVRLRATMKAEDFASRGYPFSLEVTLSYALDDNGLTCHFIAKNIGKTALPLGVGFHPYLRLGTGLIDENTVNIPATHYLEFKNFIPTGTVLPVQGTPVDFQTPRVLGTTKLNFCFTGIQRDANGIATVTMSTPGKTESASLWFDQSFPYLVMYSGDAIAPPHNRQALAVEPMTCGSDAFNHPEWGSIALAAGEEREGRFGIRAGV